MNNAPANPVRSVDHAAAARFGDQAARCDVHVHSKYSDRPSEWILRRLGSPECFTEPIDIYRRARAKGMAFVTISDHNCIDGALDIAHLPGTFISCEVTTYFPEDGCKMHILVTGITPEQWKVIDELRTNIYEFQKYVIENDIIHSVAHPLYRVNDRLSPGHIEKLLLLFNRFEGINGTRDPRACDLVNLIFRNLTPRMIEDMANRHGLAPLGPTPWNKTFTGGSDDHSGIYIASAHTVTPPAKSVEEFLGHIRRGDHEMAGRDGTSLRLAHSFYNIAYSYYKTRFLTGSESKTNLIGELIRRLVESPSPAPTTLRDKARNFVTGFVRRRRVRKLGEVKRMIVEEFANLFAEESAQPQASRPAEAERSFKTACRISQQLGFTFIQKFVDFAREGYLIESLQTLASLAPVTISIAPYLAAFKTQHKDEAFLQSVASHFEISSPMAAKSHRKAWVTDSIVGGAEGRLIHGLAGVARSRGKEFTVITCDDDHAEEAAGFKRFAPVGELSFSLEEPRRVVFPPFLEVIEYLERQKFSEVIVSTPGPMGMAALAAGRLLGMKVTAVYHAGVAGYVKEIAHDPTMEQLSRRYMQWFYDQASAVIDARDLNGAELFEQVWGDPAKRRLCGFEDLIDTDAPKGREPLSAVELERVTVAYSGAGR